jgi:2-C-methyl-D-erythritol 4-phosphate cytidylyltransferase
MRAPTPKQFIPLFGKPLARYSFDLFLSHPDIHEIVVVCEPHYQSHFETDQKKIRFALPGNRRQDSVYNGFALTDPHAGLICIHDSARPLLSQESLDELFQEARRFGAAALAVPAKNTIKEADPNLFVKRTLDRSTLWEMHTPQIATPALLHKGFELIDAYHLEITDDASIVELTGHPVKLVPDSYRNIKITTSEDWPIAETFLASLSHDS